jgi:hypothetical protein
MAKPSHHRFGKRRATDGEQNLSDCESPACRVVGRVLKSCDKFAEMSESARNVMKLV